MDDLTKKLKENWLPIVIVVAGLIKFGWVEPGPSCPELFLPAAKDEE